MVIFVLPKNKSIMRENQMIIRLALGSEIKTLNELIAQSARMLCKQDYTPEEIESAVAHVFGVDTELVEDKTYYVIEDKGQILACGGWSKRKTLLGGNQFNSRDSSLLDPKKDPAKIRAFFVHPDYARHGLGKKLLAHCEEEAKRNGFSRIEMMATLTGAKLYQTQGYMGSEQVDYSLPNGCVLKFIRMGKMLQLNFNATSSQHTQSFVFLNGSSVPTGNTAEKTSHPTPAP
jgi:GNAT superfamily N-acetyltransferase